MNSLLFASPLSRTWTVLFTSPLGRVLFLVSMLWLGASGAAQAQAPVKVNFESGVITLAGGQATSTTWQSVTFTRNFNGIIPVVVMGPAHSADTHPHAVRVRNVTATGFQWQIDEWDYLTGAHPGSITVHFFAMTPGTHVFGSQRWQVGRVATVNRANTTVPLTGFTYPPMVLTQVETTANIIAANNPRALKTRNSAVTNTGFVVNLETQQNYTTAISNEGIGYIAVSEGIGYLDGKVLWSYSPGTVGNAIKTFYTGPFTNPVVVAQTQTKNDTEPGDLRMSSLPILSNGSTRVQFSFQEETSANGSLNHTAETVAGVFVGDMPGESAAKLVFGSVNVNQSSPTQWFKVNLATAYTAPVVVFGPLTKNEATPAGVRVRNVLAVDPANGNKASFEYQVDEWDFADGIHAPETASYTVMEAGVFAIGGQVVQAGSATGVTHAGSVQYLSDSYWASDIYYEREPAVFAQCVTVNEASAVTARVDSVDTLYFWPVNFRVRLTEAENADQTHAAETVHFIVMPGGTGQFMSSNSNFRFATGIGSLSSVPSAASFGSKYASPALFAAAQGNGEASFQVEGYYETGLASDADPILLRHGQLNAAGVNLVADEDASPSADNVHAVENGAWFVVQQAADADGDGVSDTIETQMGTNPSLATSPSNASGGTATDWDTLQSLYSLTASVTTATAFETVDKKATTPVASPAVIQLSRSYGTMQLNLRVTTEAGSTDITKGNAIAADYTIPGVSGGNLLLPAGQGVTGSPYVVNINPVRDSVVEVPENLKVTFGPIPSGANPAIVTYPTYVRISDADPTNINNRSMYVAYLSRGTGVVSTGSGVAVALLEGDNNDAKTSVNVSGLSSPQNTTYLRINNDQDIRNNLGVGQINNVTWLIRAAASETTDQAMLDALNAGRIYVDINTVNYTAGEIFGFFNAAQGSEDFDPNRPDLDEPALPGSLTAVEAERDIYRFLDQCTFGANTSSYNEVKAEIELVDGTLTDGCTAANLILGYTNWLNKQMDPGTTPSPNFLTLVMSADNEEFVMRGAKPIQAGNDPQFASAGFGASYDAFGNLTNPYNNATNNAFSFNSPQNSANRRREWWTMVLQSKAQVRQRMAAALQEILVISENDTTVAGRHYGTANYWDMLAQGAFGKYRDLLEKVTYSPMMGVYLSHLRNRARYTSGNVEISPDENYAREIMQLFTVGLVLRHPDGSLVLGENGLPIPTYDQTDITELARVMTGLTYGARHAAITVRRNSSQGNVLVPSSVSASPQIEFQGVHFTDFGIGGGETWYQASWIYPMKALGRVNGINYHDFNPYVNSLGEVSGTVSKVLFAGKAGETQIPLVNTVGLADVQTHPLADEDLRIAHNALAGDPASGSYSGHPNTPVFISRLLIQRLTTSNPSPGYLYRVSEAYRTSNGNLGEVLKAILLDYEARSLAVADSLVGAGKLKEPLIQYASLFRALKAYSNAPLSNLVNMKLPFTGADSPMVTSYPASEASAFIPGATRIRLNDQTGAIGQSPQKAPSVFNWFLPDYVQPGPMANAGLFGPELQINTESTLVNRVNRHYALTWMGLTGAFPGFGLDDFVTNSANTAAQVQTSVTTLTFDSTNWDIPQTVTVRGLENQGADGTRPTSLLHTMTSADLNFAGNYTPPINFTVSDNDTTTAKLVAISQSGGSSTVVEGGATDTYTVLLSAPPAAGQTVTVTPNAVSAIQVAAAPAASPDVTFSPASVTFNTTNWNTPQVITLTANNDSVVNSFLAGSAPLNTRVAAIRHTVTSGDAGYSGLQVSDFNCAVTDNDAGRRFIPTKATTTGVAVVTEGSTTDTYTVAFAGGTAPTANVTVTFNYNSSVLDITSTDATLLKPSPGVATLTFTNSTYTGAKTVTISAVDDATFEGIQFTQITHSTASTDATYNALPCAPLDVRVNDNDSAVNNGISITQTWGNTKVVEGGLTDTYFVVLDKAPTGNVVLTWSGNNGDVAGIANLTFTPTNWWVPQTVTITGTDDLSVESTHTSTIRYVASGGGYSNVTTLDATVGDNDINSSAGIQLVQSSGTTAVTEGGATDTFTVKLTGAPNNDVVIAMTATPAGQLSLSNSTLTFNSANWDTAQTVTVTATDDAVTEGAHTAGLAFAVTSTDSRYNTFVVSDVSVAVTDNDNGSRIVIAETSGSTLVTEGSGTDTLNVSLSGPAAPAANVVVTLASAGQTALSPATLTFTPANWNTAQTVTVTANNDATAEANVTDVITASTNASQPAGFLSLSSTVVATVLDNDDINSGAGVVQIIQTNGATRVHEGGMTDTIEVALRRAPSANVTLTPTFSVANQVTLSSGTLTFTPNNWFVPQTVTITPVEDATLENAHSTVLTYTASATGGYVVQDFSTVTVAVGDNEAAQPSVNVTPTSGSVTEGGATFTYNITLGAAPLSGATVRVTPAAWLLNAANGTAQVTFSPTSVDFTSATSGGTAWNRTATITVTAADSTAAEAALDLIIVNSTSIIAGTDARYNGMVAADVAVTVNDNDTSGRIVITQTANSTLVMEDAGTDTVDIALTGPVPAADVTVNLGRASTQFRYRVNGALVDTTALTFTPANYTTPQTVTIISTADTGSEGVHADTLNATTLASSTAGYASLTTTVPVRILDSDDLARALISIVQSGGNTRVVEGGGTDSYTVVLRRAPSADVTLSCFYNPTQVSLSATSLVFTPANWNQPQTVTVTAVNDTDIENAHNSTVNYVASNTGGYRVTDTASTGAILIGDNDVYGSALVNITQSGGFTWLAENSQPSDTYTIVLGSKPQGDVTITPQSNNAIGGVNLVSFSPASITFTDANWSTPQTVTVNLAASVTNNSSRAVFIGHKIASADLNYQFYSVPSVNAIISDANETSATVGIVPTGTGTIVNEGAVGNSDTVYVFLRKAPTATVTVTPTVAAGQATVSPATLTFTTANWNQPQILTLTAVDDATLEAPPQTAVLTCTPNAVGGYAVTGVGTLTVTINDNDALGRLIITQNGTEVQEGDSITYTIKLSSAPTAPVTVTIITEKHVRPNSNLAFEFGYFASNATGSNQQKDNLLFDWSELTGIYTTAYHAARGATPESTTTAPAGHLAGSKAVIDKLDLYWGGGRFKAKWPDVAPATDNPRLAIIEAIHNSYSLTRLSTDATNFPNEVRDRCRFAAYLMSVSPSAVTSH